MIALGDFSCVRSVYLTRSRRATPTTAPAHDLEDEGTRNQGRIHLLVAGPVYFAAHRTSTTVWLAQLGSGPRKQVGLREVLLYTKIAVFA